MGRRKPRSQCRLTHLWCGLERDSAYDAGMPRGRKILVWYAPSGVERVFCSENCCEKWRPPEEAIPA